ncbi:MAG TPA: LacI family transcriptional regulator [Anaerolineales bacterium]|nr:LacI family transcriptional regulator [Anaerolineales bacterium]
MAGGRPNLVGLIFPAIGDPFMSELLEGIETKLVEEGYDLLLYSSQRQRKSPRFLPLNEHNSDGLIVFANSLSDAELARFHRLNFPLVLLHRSPPEGLDIPCVTVENKKGARTAVKHLIDHGYKNIAFLAGLESHEDAKWREIGYREELARHNIPFRPELVAYGGFSAETAKAAVENWLFEGIKIDAIFAADDNSAQGAMYTLQRAGKRIPEDVAVIGFDDIAFARYMNPPLTTIRMPIKEVGRHAAIQLIKLMKGEKVDSLTLLPTDLIIRDSCGKD